MHERIRKILFRETYKRGIDPKDLLFVKRCGGDFSSEGKAIVEILGPRTDDPLWVAKVNRTARGNARLAAEFERLRDLRSSLPEEIVESTPQPVLFEESPIGSIAIETFLSGEKLSGLFRSGSPERIWRHWFGFGKAALVWLERFNETSDRWNIELTDDWFAKTVRDPLRSHREVLREFSPDAAASIERMEAVRGLQGTRLRTVAQHGDYTPGNLISMEGRLGVIDWSPVDREAPPLLDLFQFLLSSAIYLEKGLTSNPSARIEGWVLGESRFWEKIVPDLRTAFLQAGVRPDDRIPLLRAAYGRKMLGCLRKKPVLESSLKEWLGLFESGALNRAEERVKEI